MAKNNLKKAKTPEQKPQEPTLDEQKQEVPAPGENPEFDESLDEASVGQEPQESGESMEAAQEPVKSADPIPEPTPSMDPEEANEPQEPEDPAEEPLPEPTLGITAEAKKEDETDEEYEDRIIMSEMFKYMTGADGIPDSGVDVTKMVKDAWAVRKQGKPFPGFLTAKTILAKEFKAEAEKLKAKKA